MTQFTQTTISIKPPITSFIAPFLKLKPDLIEINMSMGKMYTLKDFETENV